MKPFLSVLTFLACVQLSSCATAPKVADHVEFKIDPKAKPDTAPVVITPAKMTTGSAVYTYEQKPWASQWIKCSIDNTRGTVLVMHRFGAGFEPDAFCKGWIAQSFIKKGFQVVTVNRPSYVGSTGPEDLAGPQSLTAIKAGVDASGVAPQIMGTWGYDVGTIAAAYFAKITPNIKWLILGGGIYDLEVTARATESAELRTAIAAIKAKEGDIAFERRSIAWDFNGLTKTLALYHVKDDKFAPENQASSFDAQLRTAEYKVFNNEIAGGTHDLPWRNHAAILAAAIEQVAPTEKTK